MNQLDNNRYSIDKKQQIDLVSILRTIWVRRKFVLKVFGISVIIGLVVAFSQPKEYTTQVLMAPEVSTKGASGNLGMLASMAGINISGSSTGEALSPELYPNIVKSTPFLLDLLPIKVEVEKQANQQMTLYNYMEDHQNKAWWGHILTFPFKIIGYTISLFKGKEPVHSDQHINAFQLTAEQSAVMKSVSERILVNVDKKTGVISLSVTMQDALISAMLTDTVMKNLQTYVTNYRTNKAKGDLAYAEKLYEEVKGNYYEAQQKYANFADTNRDINLTGFRTRLERLQNEVTLSYGLYNQVSQQLQMAKAKVQEETPVFTVIQPASVTLTPSKPNKPLVLIGFTLMSLIFSVGWILSGLELKQFRKNKKKEV